MPILPYKGVMPTIEENVFIAPGAIVIGDVTIREGASVWYNAVLRGDINKIVVGHHSNIQDNAVLHLADDFACILGNYVTVGHSAIVHACAVGDECLIGMGAIILDGAEIGEQLAIANRSPSTRSIAPMFPMPLDDFAIKSTLVRTSPPMCTIGDYPV